ncbi:MAG: HesA/MoeB/ThiF family protein [Bacteroidales bacterium]|nr:HesA/MoeB/ThiF family protein [Bacteroidales bacterium]
MNSDILTQRELRRYLYQIDLPSVGIKGQEKIKQSRVLVIGAGGKGTALLQNLVASGVGSIGISDNTMVTEEFLPNQRLFGDSDLGKQKAILSKQKLKHINHLVHIELHNICLTPTTISNVLKDYDIIADASDNFSAHYLISDTAIELGKPVVYGSLSGAGSEVTVFNYQEGPSFRDLYPAKPSKNLSSSVEGMVSAGTLTTITGTIMANEVIKIILGLQNTLSGKLFIFNIIDYHTEIREFEKGSGSFHTRN